MSINDDRLSNPIPRPETTDIDYIAIGETLRRVYTWFASMNHRALISDLDMVGEQDWGTDATHTHRAIAALVNAGWLQLTALGGGLGVSARIPLRMALADEYEAIAREWIYSW